MHRSPILHALAAMLALFIISFVFIDAAIVNDVLDAYAIAAGIFVITRYRKEIYRALLSPNPDGAQCLIVSIGGISLSIALLRGLREFGLEMGIIDSNIIRWSFALLTVVMVFSMFLKVIAPPLPPMASRRFEVALRPWIAFIFAIVSGTFLSLIILMIRRFT